MNYANMIKEEKLKQGFIISVLISTIAGTFTTGIGLYDRLVDRHRQSKLDKGQDAKIKELERRVNEADGQNNQGQAQRQRSQLDYPLRDSLGTSGAVIQREYDRGYASIGPKFAEGDLIAQTQLQSQIITLQGTVIKLLEEAIYTGEMPDINKLYNASEFARQGSIRALRDQYQRMLQGAPVRRPIGPIRRTSSTPALRESSSEISRRPQKALTFDTAGPLFCRYAEDLQRTNRPIDETFGDGGSGICPVCGVYMAFKPGRSWRLPKEVVLERVSRGGPGDTEIIETIEHRTYVLNNRFLVKCHRPSGGYACYLCFEHREGDTLFKGIEGLVKHLVDQHSVSEFERDPDIR